MMAATINSIIPSSATASSPMASSPMASSAMASSTMASPPMASSAMASSAMASPPTASFTIASSTMASPLLIQSGEVTLPLLAEHSLVVQAGATATIIATALPSQQFHIIVEEGARATMCVVHPNVKSPPRTSNQGMAHFEIHTAHTGINTGVINSICKNYADIKKDALLQRVDVLLGDGHLNLQTKLLEPGAEMIAVQAFVGSADIQSDVYHLASHTKSLMLAKGVLQKSTGKYRGTIKIEKQASGCRAHQRSDMLLLDEASKGDAEPILDVHNDDVICSHGATLGQIDELHLFYLKSRGLPEAAARQMIIAGFLQPILEFIPRESLREEIAREIQHHLQLDGWNVSINTKYNPGYENKNHM